MENINISISSNEIQMVIKNLPTNKSPETESFTGESYQTLKRTANTYSSPTLQKSLQREEHSQAYSTRPPSP